MLNSGSGGGSYPTGGGQWSSQAAATAQKSCRPPKDRPRFFLSCTYTFASLSGSQKSVNQRYYTYIYICVYTRVITIILYTFRIYTRRHRHLCTGRRLLCCRFSEGIFIFFFLVCPTLAARAKRFNNRSRANRTIWCFDTAGGNKNNKNLGNVYATSSARAQIPRNARPRYRPYPSTRPTNVFFSFLTPLYFRDVSTRVVPYVVFGIINNAKFSFSFLLFFFNVNVERCRQVLMSRVMRYRVRNHYTADDEPTLLWLPLRVNSAGIHP